jgi:hypothetical protein
VQSIGEIGDLMGIKKKKNREGDEEAWKKKKRV